MMRLVRVAVREYAGGSPIRRAPVRPGGRFVVRRRRRFRLSTTGYRTCGGPWDAGAVWQLRVPRYLGGRLERVRCL